MDFGIDGLDNLDRAFAGLPGSVAAGVKLDAVAAVRGAVWEWGRVDINPGPKTLWSTGPGGEAVLTITAPHGWIRVNRDQYIRILKDELKRANFSGTAPGQWPGMLRTVLGLAAERCANLMAVTAPVDTGLLRASIHPVAENDPVMSQAGNELDLGSGWL